MPRNKKEKLICELKDETRGERLWYWLNQRDMPSEGTDNWKQRLTVYDKMLISSIRKAMDGNAQLFKSIQEEIHGKVTEAKGIATEGGKDAGAKFNIPKTVSQLKIEDEIKEREDSDDTI